MKSLRSSLALCCILPWIASAHAKSTADTTLGKVEKVTIEEDKVTIVAKAVTQMIVLTGDFGHRSFIKVASDRATFIILRQRPTASDGEAARKVYAEGWEMTIKAAKLLKEEKTTGKIGYYDPEITISGPLITAIKGYGYLSPPK